MENYVDPIEEQFKRIQTSKKQESQKKKVPFDVKNYLNVKLTSKENEKNLTIRILKLTPDAETPFAEVHTHYLPSAKKAYICTKLTENLPAHVDNNCPFCDIRDEAHLQQKGADQATWDKFKEIYKQNAAMLNYVVRVVDRDDEEFGIKFWKISEPVYKMIYRIYQANKADGIDIFDYENGKDLTVTIERTLGKTKVTSVTAKNKLTPLAESQEVMNKLITDDKAWSDVYGIKPYEYLEIMIKGGTPFFDKTSKKWVEKTEETEKDENFENQYLETEGVENNETPDDLPF